MKEQRRRFSRFYLFPLCPIFARISVLGPRGDDGPEVPLLLQWLGLALQNESPEGRERGLAFQILQAQGKQPPISRSRGTLDLFWLFSLKHMQGRSLLRLWQWCSRMHKMNVRMIVIHSSPSENLVGGPSLRCCSGRACKTSPERPGCTASVWC